MYKNKVCSLILTHSCNLACVYCYEKHKSDCRMSFATAKEIIRREFELVESSDKYGSLRIEFFGGEPFLEFDLLRRIVEWVEFEAWAVPYRFFVTTNGTLLTPVMKKWLKEQKDRLTVGLSFDGTPEMQNVNRSNSFDKIDLPFFLENYPEQTIKMTVSTLSLNLFAQGVIYLQERGFRVDPSCACGEDWDDKCFQEYQSQLFQLAQYYLDHPDTDPIGLLDIHFNDVLLPVFETPRCGAGKGFVTYDVTGERYPCHMFSPVVLSLERSKHFSNIDIQEQTSFMDTRCTTCPVVNICTTCYGYNYSQVGYPGVRDVRLCKLFQCQCKVVAWFEVQQFERSKQRGNMLCRDEINNIKGILYFYKNYRNLGFQQGSQQSTLGIQEYIDE